MIQIGVGFQQKFLELAERGLSYGFDENRAPGDRHPGKLVKVSRDGAQREKDSQKDRRRRLVHSGFAFAFGRERNQSIGTPRTTIAAFTPPWRRSPAIETTPKIDNAMRAVSFNVFMGYLPMLFDFRSERLKRVWNFTEAASGKRLSQSIERLRDSLHPMDCRNRNNQKADAKDKPAMLKKAPHAGRILPPSEPLRRGRPPVFQKHRATTLRTR